MIFALSKILLFLLKPLVWVFCLLIIAIFNKNGNRRKILFFIAAGMLFVFSNSFLVGKALNGYEASYPPPQTYDIGIVLGGFSAVNEARNELVLHWTADRLFQAIALYKKGTIKKILVCSGNSNLGNNRIKEADYVGAYLKKIGIPDSAILIENQSRNTVENGANSFKLIQKVQPNAKVIVITSAWHIPRTKLIFSKYFGNNIAYYPTNYMGKTGYQFSDFVLPSGNALAQWEIVIKEWVGYCVDYFRA